MIYLCPPRVYLRHSPFVPYLPLHFSNRFSKIYTYDLSSHIFLTTNAVDNSWRHGAPLRAPIHNLYIRILYSYRKFIFHLFAELIVACTLILSLH